MVQLQRIFSGAGAGACMGHPPPNFPILAYPSRRAGVPMEVMDLMLGAFVDDYSARVVDFFAMPPSGTGVSVEAVDRVFHANMLDMLKQTGRNGGWLVSFSSWFERWLSGVDINTQQSFEALNQRAVAVVIDPIQSSVKGH